MENRHDWHTMHGLQWTGPEYIRTTCNKANCNTSGSQARSRLVLHGLQLFEPLDVLRHDLQLFEPAETTAAGNGLQCYDVHQGQPAALAML